MVEREAVVGHAKLHGESPDEEKTVGTVAPFVSGGGPLWVPSLSSGLFGAGAKARAYVLNCLRYERGD